jgi:hypothetical protein
MHTNAHMQLKGQTGVMTLDLLAFSGSLNPFHFLLCYITVLCLHISVVTINPQAGQTTNYPTLEAF